MVGWDTGLTLADRFSRHAGDADHLYGHLMREMAADWEAGGPVRAICADYEQAPSGSAIQLRFLAAVFRLVLSGRAPELVRFYPCLGGTAEPAEAWPRVRAVVVAHADEIRTGLATAPQTNEVGRSAALLAGLFDVVRASGMSRIRLLELGASAGLNLLLDQFAFLGSDWRWGRANSSVRLVDPITGPVSPVPFTVVGRRGCDLHPVDPTSAAGRQLLTSFVWPFDIDRHQRLTAAFHLAAQHPVVVDQAGAAGWLPAQLADRDPAVLTVVWHSITQLYWPDSERQVVDAGLAEAGQKHPLAQVALEFDANDARVRQPELWTRLWRPGQLIRDRHLGHAHDHGLPVRLRAQVQ